eukprot:scaffold103869_cov13-Tisochrysis_lutea.AAC.1
MESLARRNITMHVVMVLEGLARRGIAARYYGYFCYTCLCSKHVRPISGACMSRQPTERVGSGVGTFTLTRLAIQREGQARCQHVCSS